MICPVDPNDPSTQMGQGNVRQFGEDLDATCGTAYAERRIRPRIQWLAEIRG